MAAVIQPIRYQKVPGTGTHLFARVKLFVGPDHLLQVTSNGFVETYKRFFFHDIQVLSLHKTVAGTVTDLIAAGLTVLFASSAIAVQVEGSLGGAIALWILTGIVAGFLAVNLVAGPTCACYIQTAVQQQRLYSLRRVKRARRLISQIKPLLAAVQGAALAPPYAAPATAAAAPAPPLASDVPTPPLISAAEPAAPQLAEPPPATPSEPAGGAAE